MTWLLLYLLSVIIIAGSILEYINNNDSLKFRRLRIQLGFQPDTYVLIFFCALFWPFVLIYILFKNK